MHALVLTDANGRTFGSAKQETDYISKTSVANVLVPGPGNLVPVMVIKESKTAP